MRAVVTLAAIGASAALVACGGEDASGEDEQAKFEDAQLEFAQCMREHGVDVPDPESGGDGGLRFELQGQVDDQDFQEAQEACRPILEDAIPEGDRPDPAEVRDQLHEMTECLRDRGYDVPEPQIFGPGDEPPDEPPAPSKELEDLMDDPEFQQAQEECSEEAGLEDGGPGLRVGGPGGSDDGPSTEESEE